MKRKSVASSAIASLGHDAKTNTLHVEFASGRVYAYSGVSADEHKALAAADSIGAHFNEHIRPHFAARSLDPKHL